MENICPSLSVSNGREQQSCVRLGDLRTGNSAKRCTTKPFYANAK